MSFKSVQMEVVRVTNPQIIYWGMIGRLGGNYGVFENFTASIGDLMVTN